MKSIKALVLCLFIFFIIPALGDDKPHLLAQVQPSDNGGFTDQPVQAAVEPSDNGGFTDQQSYSTAMPSDGGGFSGGPGGSYVTTQPSDYGQMTDMGGQGQGFGPQMGQAGPNSMWIVDSTGLNRYPSMSIPLYGYAREELTPSQGGYVVVEEQYPNGKIETYNMGYVQPFHTYRLWFYGDVPGTHLMRYSVSGGQYSNTVKFFVQGGGYSEQPYYANHYVNHLGGYGDYGGSYSSSSYGSGGSMSLSTSFG